MYNFCILLFLSIFILNIFNLLKHLRTNGTTLPSISMEKFSNVVREILQIIPVKENY